MKRGVPDNKIALAVGSIIFIMIIFGTVMILSGRTVKVVGETIIYNSETEQSEIITMTPCSLLRCEGWKKPVLLGYEDIVRDKYALCVCAFVRDGRAYYDEMQIKKIKTTRQY